MDVYPDIAFDLKVLPQSALLKRLLTWAFDLARHRADGIIALGDEMKDRLIAHGIAPEKIHVCHNWTDGEEILPLPFPEGPLTVHYSGNFGRAHEVATIRKVILHFREDARFRFILSGGGKQHAALEALCHESKIESVTFEPYCSRDHLGRRLAEGHLGLITQLPETLGSIVPSKTYGIMAAGRPLLFVGPSESTPARIIRRFDCGWHIEPGDALGLISLLETLDLHRDLIASAGARARRVFEENYDRSIGIANICKVLGIEVPADKELRAMSEHARG